MQILQNHFFLLYYHKGGFLMSSREGDGRRRYAGAIFYYCGQFFNEAYSESLLLKILGSFWCPKSEVFKTSNQLLTLPTLTNVLLLVSGIHQFPSTCLPCLNHFGTIDFGNACILPLCFRGWYLIYMIVNRFCSSCLSWFFFAFITAVTLAMEKKWWCICCSDRVIPNWFCLCPCCCVSVRLQVQMDW